MHNTKYLSLLRSRTAHGIAGALAWTIVVSGCGGGDGGPDASPTATATVSATASATTTATANATTTATPILTPTGTPSPIAPVQFRGFYVSSTASGADGPLTFRVNAQGQVTGQISVLGASGVSFPLLVRGTLSIPLSQANDLNATAYLNLTASGVSGAQVIAYRFTGTVARNAAAIVAGSGVAVTQLGSDSKSETIQVTRRSS